MVPTISNQCAGFVTDFGRGALTARTYFLHPFKSWRMVAIGQKLTPQLPRANIPLVHTQSKTPWRSNMWIFALLGPVIPILFLVFAIDEYLGTKVILQGTVLAYVQGLVPAICAGYVFNRLQFPMPQFSSLRKLFAGAVVGCVSGFLGTVGYALILSLWGGFSIVVFLMFMGTLSGTVCGIIIAGRHVWVERSM